MKKILITLFICMILTITIVSAGILDISKEQPTLKDGLIISDSANKYPAISIKSNWDLPLISKDIADLVLIEHTENCGSSGCISGGQTRLYEKGSLFDGFEFYTINEDGSRTLQPIRKYEVYIKTDKEEFEVDDYETKCIEKFSKINQSSYQECSKIKSGTHIENKPLWEKYEIGSEVEANLYEWELRGEKKSDRTVDWIATVGGKKIKSWAEWGGAELTNNLEEYWKMDEISGTNAMGSLGRHNATTTNLFWNNSGIINGTGISDTTTFPVIDTNYAPSASVTALTFNFWFKTSILDGRQVICFTGIYDCGTPDSNGDFRAYINGVTMQSDWFDDTSRNQADTPAINTDSWQMITYVINETTITGYVNGTAGVPISASGFTWTGSDEFYPFKLDGAWSSNTSIDEIGIWNRTLTSSEIIDLYNNGMAITYPFTAGQVGLNFPTDNYFSPLNEVEFNCTATITGATLTNMSLWHNASGTWARNQTLVKTGTTNESIFNVTFLDSSYLWTCSACDSDGDCGFATENRTVSIDITSPSITINRPSAIENIGYSNVNQTLNWTVTDTNFASAWYNYNGTNVSVYGEENITSFQLDGNDRNLTFWANDSVGNVNSSFVEWDYNIFVNSKSYDDEIPEGALDEFNLEIIVNDGILITQAIFNYNNTNYTTDVSYSIGVYNISASIFAPTVTTDTNFTFNFFLIVDGNTYTLNSYNQSVLNLNFGICGGISNDTLMIISLKDEIMKTDLVGDIDVGGEIISKSSNQVVATIYQNFTGVANASICFSPPSDYDLYYFSSEIRYVASGYAPELYIIQYADMADYPINLSLFDLDLNHSTNFLIKYQDDSLITVEGAVIQLLKKYISEGIYEVVEAPLTSNIGTSVVHIDLNTNLYRAIVVKNGVILDTFDNLVFNCESELSGLCTQNLFGNVNSQNSLLVDNLDDFSYAISELNNTITTTFSIPSGTSSSINILLIQEDVFGNTNLCNQTIVSSSGSIDCSYNDTIGDSIIFLEIRKNSELKAEQSFFIPEEGGVDFLGNNFFIVLILLLSLVGMAMSSPEWMTIIGVVTFVLAGGLWLINGVNFVVGLGSLIWLLIVAVIIILKLSKQEDR